MPHALNGSVSIYYEIIGEGEPILWLQGLGASHSAWAAQLFYFDQRYRCILPDNRDSGKSSRVHTPYTTHDMAWDAVAALDDAGIRKAHVVGISMGAAIAQELALAVPERVGSLVLLSAFARQDARMTATLEMWCELYPVVGHRLFHRQTEPWLFSPSYFERESNLRALRRYIEKDPTPQDAAAFARQAAASTLHDTRSLAADISVPTLLMAGELDLLVPPRYGRELSELIPNAEWQVREGVVHSLNLENQRDFNKRVDDFIASHPLHS